MAFNVPIQVSPGDAQSKIKGVGDALADTEKRSDQLARSLGRLGQNFSSLNEVMERRARATELHARLNNNLSVSFDRIGQAMQREQAMLRSIRGDTEAYARDVQTLDALLKKNMITIDQRNAALARSRAAAGIGDPTAAVSLPSAKAIAPSGVGGAVAGQLAGIAGPAALAAGGIGLVMESLDAMSRKAAEMRDATAAMLRFKDTVEGARESAERMRSVANLLGEDLKTTTGAFLDVAGAASDLGLSEAKLEDITRSLGMIMKIEGRSIGDVGAVMQTLEFAISKGSISSGEMARIMKQFPPLAKVWRDEFGATTKQLLDAAESGQLANLGLDRLLTSIRTWPELIDQMEKRLQATLSTSTILTGEWQKEWKQLELLKMRKLETADANRQLLDTWDHTVEKSNLLARGFDLATESVTRLWDALRNDPWGGAANNRSGLGVFLSEGIGNFNILLDRGKQHIDRWRDAAREAAREAKAWAAEVERISRLEPRLRSVGPPGHRNMFLPDSQASFADISPMLDPFEGRFRESIGLEKMAGDIERANAQLSAFERAWQGLSSTMEQGVMQQVSRLGDELADLFMTGEMGWRSMIDAMIKDLTRLAIRQAVVFGFQSATGLGVPGSAGLNLRVPGFASGGTARVDTDSMFVGLRVTPNERIIVQTPGQRMRDTERPAAAAPAPAPVIVNQYDPRALLQVLQTREGATVIHNILRAYPGLRR